MSKIAVKLDIDDNAVVFLPIYSHCKCDVWKVSEIPNDFSLVEELVFNENEFINQMNRNNSESKSDETEPDQYITCYFINGAKFVQMFIFEFIRDNDAAIQPSDSDLSILGELEFQRKKEQCTFQIIGNLNPINTCNKIDYQMGGGLYTRIWLSSDNLKHLNNLGFLEPGEHHEKHCEMWCVSAEMITVCYNVCWPVWADVNYMRKLYAELTIIMKAQGYKAHLGDMIDCADAMVTLIDDLRKNPITLDEGCGLRFSFGLVVKNKIVPQF